MFTHCVMCGDDSLADTLTKADAHLIAASPDLLAACKGALALLEVNHEGWCIRADGPEFVALRKAIAKAEGREG
jgi:hypothetical protein